MTEQKLPFSQWNPIIAENFVKEWEGLSLKAYKCTAGTWTIGYGHTKGVRPGQVISLLQAERFLRDDLEDHAEDLAPYVTCRLTPSRCWTWLLISEFRQSQNRTHCSI